MAVGIEIQDSDYNAIRKKIIAVMGSGGTNPVTNQADASYGYGQTLVSSEDVVKGEKITKQQWDALRFDILNARIHQDGATPSIVQAVKGQPIRFGASHPNTAYNAQSDTAISNRFNLGAGQFVISSGTTQTRTASWKNSVTSTVTVNFNTADQTRWFFNSGGKTRFASSRSGGATTAQNNSWTNLLNSIGIVEFGAITLPVGLYSLTNADQTLIAQSSTSPYGSNNYVIKVRSNVANNANGTATQITFTVVWTDGYVDPGPLGPPFTDDVVDGTLTLTVEEQRASGILQPVGTGAFIVAPPSYSSTAIVGS